MKSKLQKFDYLKQSHPKPKLEPMNSPTPTPKVKFLLLGLGLGQHSSQTENQRSFLCTHFDVNYYFAIIPYTHRTLLIVHPTSRPQTKRHGRPHTKLLPSIIQWTVATVSVHYTVVMVQNYSFPYAKTNGLLWKSLSQFSISLVPPPHKF